MQVFIVGSPLETAQALDGARLRKQIIEVRQILDALNGAKAWRNHPCVLQYRGHEMWLGFYKYCLEYSLGGEFIKEWKSLTEIEKTCGISRSGITRCCLGIFKQCKGYLWKFKDIDNE